MILLSVGAAIAAATVAVVGMVVRRGLRPLSALAERAATIDASSLQLRFPTEKIPAELLPIAQRLNDLVARLEASFNRERRFSADVAHELRTPISELRALAEVSLKWPGDVTEATLEDALNIALQMESIATGLMALARCEANLVNVRPEPISISALFQEVLPPLAAKVRAKQLDIAIDVPEETCWFTDRATLRSIFTNLLSNAVDHTQPNSSVKARVEKNGAGERLLVSNDSGSLVEEDIPRLFERFWQKDEARSSPDHCGLGLALARAYAQSLGMTLDAQLNHTDVIFILSGASPCSGADHLQNRIL
jgi:two-component system sensor histidine kinase QseC